jgi:hypothetical protein
VYAHPQLAAYEAGLERERGVERTLWLAGPDGEQLSLPGSLWPAGCAMGGGGPIYFGPMPLSDANTLLEAWEHPLGAYKRPFGYQAWGMAVDGQPVSVVVSGSTVSATVREKGGRVWKRRELVELARIARAPDHPGVMRAMLRLWRDYLACRWTYWPVKAAVSYALPGREGNLYRFDGFAYHGTRKPWGGSATWSNPSVANGIGDGHKRLFIYEYADADA